MVAHTQNKESNKDLEENFHYIEEHLPQTHPSVADLCGISLEKLFQLEAFWHSFTDPEFPSSQD